jgi:hypothetical protein
VKPAVLVTQFLDSIFEFSRPVTKPDLIHFRVLEAFVCGAAIWASWEWALAISGQIATPALLGLAKVTGIPFVSRTSAVLAATGITVCACSAFARIRPATSYTAVVGLMHLLYVSRWAYGKANHTDNMVGMTIVCLALGYALFRDDEARRVRGVLGFVFVAIGIIYTFAGLAKLRTTGLGWANGAHLQIWIYEAHTGELARFGQSNFTALQTFLLEHTRIGSLLLAGSLAIECCGAAVCFARTRHFALLAMISLHIGIWFVLDIRFSFYMIELLILFVPKCFPSAELGPDESMT